MGCGSSKHTLERVDDSVHVMLAHEKKVALKKGQKAATEYVPRAEHPLLKAAAQPAQPAPVAEEEQDGALDTALRADSQAQKTDN
jgi:hypothetical protein